MDPSPPVQLEAPVADADRATIVAKGRRRWGLGMVAAVTAGLFIVGMWAFVYIWAAVQRPVDRLDSPAFGQRAEPVCAVTAGELAALPKAFESKGNVQRADVVAQTNADLRAMLTRLAAVAPTSGHDGRVVHEWLGDYATYVSNRERYATRLHADPTARFYESEKNPGEQISVPVDSFASANGMPDCTTPGDLS